MASKIEKRLTRQLRARGVKNSAGAARGLLKKFGHVRSDGKLTKKGKKKNAMSPGARAKARGAKYSKGKHKASDYKYNKKTNRVKLKKR